MLKKDIRHFTWGRGVKKLLLANPKLLNPITLRCVDAIVPLKSNQIAKPYC